MTGVMYDNLLGQGMNPLVASKLDKIHQEGLISVDELDDRALDALKEFSEDDALQILEQFTKSDLSHVQDKNAFLCGVMKTYRAKMKADEATGATGDESRGGPVGEKVKELLNRTGYTLDITTERRKYGGPPPGWEGPVPGTGEEKFSSTIFIGKLPRDMYEDELVPLCEPHGTLYDLQIMVDPFSGLTKGYAFCTYTTKEGALAAIKNINGKEVRDGKKLGVYMSQANTRLFVGSIPKSKTKKEIYDEFAAQVEHLSDVIVYANPEDSSNNNRGFAFLDFESHEDASLARRRLMSGSIKVFGGITPKADWADPVDEPDEDVMSPVKAVYVRNLSPAIDEVKLNELFEQYGAVEKVNIIKDFAFIHFLNREDAIRAIAELDGQELDDLKIEVSLAKQQVDKRSGSFNQGGRGRGGGLGHAGYGTERGDYGGGYGNNYGSYGGNEGYNEGYGFEDPSYGNYHGPSALGPMGR